MDVYDFIRENADPIWLKQNEMWEELHAREVADDADFAGHHDADFAGHHDADDVPW